MLIKYWKMNLKFEFDKWHC